MEEVYGLWSGKKQQNGGVNFSTLHYPLLMTEKLCLQWNDFKDNVNMAFGNLRKEKDFSDVTLACEDLELETHKVILSSCSPFFKRLLKRTSKHQLIYMRGIKADQLNAVVDFIYYGEVSILEKELKTFLTIAEELELKGLSVEDSEEVEEAKTQAEQLKDLKSRRSDVENIVRKPSQSEQKIDKTQTALKSFSKQKIHIPEETLKKMDSLFVKFKRGEHYTCKMCQFNSKYKGHMREHVETHIEGPRYPCNLCGKTMRGSAVLRKHFEKCEV